jgi:hypothetical protein
MPHQDLFGSIANDPTRLSLTDGHNTNAKKLKPIVNDSGLG